MRFELWQALERVAARFRSLRLWGGLALCWLLWAAVGGGMYAVTARSPNAASFGWQQIGILALLAALTGGVYALFALRTRRDHRWVARKIEARHPELSAVLMAAQQQQASGETGRYGFLQSAVIAEALSHRRRHNWDETVSSWKLRSAQLAHIAALALMVVVLTGLGGQAQQQAQGPNVEDRQQPQIVAIDSQGHELTVEPGDTELERGTSLLVVARFAGQVPADVNLILEPANQPPIASTGDGVEADAAQEVEANHTRAMTRSLEDPTFAANVRDVTADLDYCVEFKGGKSETFHVTVFEFPVVRRVDAELTFPSFARQQPKRVEDVRHVTAVEGTEARLFFRLNKDVPVAQLLRDDNEVIELTRSSEQDDAGPLYEATVIVTKTHRYRVRLEDDRGRSNKIPTEIFINATKNRSTNVVVTRPGQDVRVSPVEELELRGKVTDDFGIVRYGVTYMPAGGEPVDVVLHDALENDTPTEEIPTIREADVAYTLSFEELQAQPDQLVTYYMWADDLDVNGQPRRTFSDMYFAEVRHLDEIFRQGEQPTAGQQQQQQQGQQGEEQNQNGQQAEQLAELQKQIINGTWTLVRRETPEAPSEQFVEDNRVLQEAQINVLEQAQEMLASGEVQDPISLEGLDSAIVNMQEALQRLTNAVDEESVDGDRQALSYEQAAYQDLLKLRAREFEVTQNNQQQQSQSARNAQSNSSPSQQQLRQLELNNDQNRYESQQQAQQRREEQQQREQQEDQEMLNRLRELAQRQQDLNDRLRELQSAMEEAETEEERAELERQLKRLRDQQEQLMRDTDELREQTESEENRQRMQQESQQLEETRENQRRAAEALEQGEVSQALSEGARAETGLNELRDDFRQSTADRFSEDLREMRNQAQDLDENQERITQELEDLTNQEQRTLRDSGEREALQDQLDEQRDNLGELLEQVRQVGQEAEQPDPRLAQQLFDTLQDAMRQNIDQDLYDTDRALDRGLTQDAADLSRQASQNLDNLREGVERAAESIVGDETEALRQAQRELDDLADQLNEEINQASGQPSSQGQNDQDQPAEQQGQQGQQAEQGEDQQSGQQGQNQQSQDQQSQNQPGQNQQNQQGQGLNQQGQNQQSQDQQGQNQQGQDQQGQSQQGQNQQGGGQRGDNQQNANQQGDPQQQGSGNRTGEDQPGQNQPNQQQSDPQQRGGQPGDGRPTLDDLIRGFEQGNPNGGGGGDPNGPITGEDYREWIDRMRNVEELIDDSELRGEAARIRDRVRGAREDYRKHAAEPDWDKLQDLIAEPLAELQRKINEEIRRRENPDALVPIDRDPVPAQYSEAVRRYYEKLGSGRATQPGEQSGGGQ